MSDELAPIIIKKKKGHGHGHHGGAWKIAYADFVTAMMAFFLLMWLLNATSEEQKRGIADFFSPVSVFEIRGFSGGAMGSKSVAVEGAFDGRGPPEQTLTPMPGSVGKEERTEIIMKEEHKGIESSSGNADEANNADGNKVAVDSGWRDVKPSELSDQEVVAIPIIVKEKSDESDQTAENETEGSGNNQSGNAKVSDNAGSGHDTEYLKNEAYRQARIEDLKALEEQQFKNAEEDLRKAISEDEELKEFGDSLVVTRTEVGLRIQIVDQHEVAFFPNGQSEMYEHTKKMLLKIAKIIRSLDKRVLISGHTDAKPFRTDNGYSNWELSTDRANASRRELVKLGVDQKLISRVVGLADRDPIDSKNPESPVNRRISITLLRSDFSKTNIEDDISPKNEQEDIKGDNEESEQGVVVSKPPQATTETSKEEDSSEAVIDEPNKPEVKPITEDIHKTSEHAGNENEYGPSSDSSRNSSENIHAVEEQEKNNNQVESENYDEDQITKDNNTQEEKEYPQIPFILR